MRQIFRYIYWSRYNYVPVLGFSEIQVVDAWTRIIRLMYPDLASSVTDTCKQLWKHIDFEQHRPGPYVEEMAGIGLPPCKLWTVIIRCLD
jgi:hypothetical protein